MTLAALVELDDEDDTVYLLVESLFLQAQSTGHSDKILSIFKKECSKALFTPELIDLLYARTCFYFKDDARLLQQGSRTFI